MALYRNIAGFLPNTGGYLGEPGQVGLTIKDLFGPDRTEVIKDIFGQNTDTIRPYTPAESNSPEPVTTGGPYIIRDFTDYPQVPTVNIDGTSPGAPDALPTEVPPTHNAEAGDIFTATSIKQNILPLLTLAGLVLVAIKGDALLPKRKKTVFVVGLGALYYGLAKNQTT